MASDVVSQLTVTDTMPYMKELNAPIYVAGHNGLVGGAITRALRDAGYSRLLGQSRAELNLEDPTAVDAFFQRERPQFVFLAAAKVGGIHANSTYPADFIRSNLLIQLNVVEAAYRAGTERLMFLGSSCIYPKFAHQPISEDELLGGRLEPTNQPYAVAKIAGIELCRSYNRQFGTRFFSVMPTNLYGPGDNFDLQNAHVIPALMHRFHLAKRAGSPSVAVWGSGQPRREFLHVDDMADACIFLMRRYEGPDIINIGCGDDVSIAEAAQLVKRVVGYEGDIVFDPTKPDGTPRKLLDVSKLFALGWRPRVQLEAGLVGMYRWFSEHETEARR
jgi:GDP-L-fucose synthase